MIHSQHNRNLTALIFAALFAALIPGSSMGANSCVTCHAEINPEVVDAFASDVHGAAGLTCVSCHGGDASIDDEEAMNPKRGYVGVPTKQKQPEFCGKCHSNPVFMRAYNTALPTDQVDKYWTSRHGELLKKGDQNVAVCASCHKAHGIMTASEAKSSVYPLNVPKTCAGCHSDASLMAPYNIATDQFAQYTDSANVHGYALFNKRDLAAPTCNDCHGNHGALPPGVNQVAQVCTQCHSHNGELFRKSPHKDAFDALEVSECAFCHQKAPDVNEPHKRIHTIVKPDYKLIGVTEGALCMQCHSQGDEGWATADSIGRWSSELASLMDSTQTMLHYVGKRGFEISDAEWKLNSEVLQATMELRTVIHAFNLDKYKPAYITADTALQSVNRIGRIALQELGGRRFYFILASASIILLILALALKLREMEKRE